MQTATSTNTLQARIEVLRQEWSREVDEVADEFRRASTRSSRRLKVSSSTSKTIEALGSEEGEPYSVAASSFADDVGSTLRASGKPNAKVTFQETWLGFGSGDFVATNL